MVVRKLQPAAADPRTLLMAVYIAPSLPTPPASFDLTTKVKSPWGTMEDDQIGDCTCAAAGRLIMEWTANAGKKVIVPTDDQIVAAVTGYNPKTGANDNGAVEIDVLNLLAVERHCRTPDWRVRRARSVEPQPHHGCGVRPRRLLHRDAVAHQRTGAGAKPPAVVGASGRAD